MKGLGTTGVGAHGTSSWSSDRRRGRDPNELLVRVRAASLNYRDKAIVDGKYLPDKLPRPLIPVSDAAGIVRRWGRA